MRTLTALLLALVFAVAACGGGGNNAELRADPDVQAILDGYQQLGASDAELDKMVADLEAALDVYDNDTERRAYLQAVREQVETSVEATQDMNDG